eukprot:COSAG02_NODE_1210_length_13856_cov_12.266182_4_plen_64_part_00
MTRSFYRFHFNAYCLPSLSQPWRAINVSGQAFATTRGLKGGDSRGRRIRGALGIQGGTSALVS